MDKTKKRRKKKLNKKILIPFIIVIIITIIPMYRYINNKKENVLSKEKTQVFIKLIDDLNIDVYEKVTNLSFIEMVENGTIVSKETSIDTSKVGKQEVKIAYKDNNNREAEYTFNINVVDNEAPKIDVKDTITTTEGQKIDFQANVKVTDNYDETVKIDVEGEYDFNKKGEYTIYFIAKDSSGNTTKKEAKLIVKERVSQPNQSEEPQDKDGEFTTSKGFKGVTKNGITYIDGVLIANKTYALPASFNPGGLTRETKEAFDKFVAAAKLDGINIWCQSGFRSFATQERLYNNYVARDGKEAADIYSARPGHSEHQTGLACDINDVINSSFNNSAEAKWATKNAYKYGLILRYPEGKSDETGYKYESWHFRYVGVDLATKLYNNGDWITLEDYFGITSKY